jgi:hypothetical protein
MLKNRGYFYCLLFFLVGVIGGIITSYVYDFINSQPWSSTLNNVSIYLVSLVSSNLGIDLKLWWFYLLLGLIILMPVVFYLINKRTIPPEIANYTEDQFKNWYWRWEWTWNSVINQWEVKNLTPFCPDCNTELLNKSSFKASMAVCPQCHRRFDAQLGEYDEAKEIEYIIHKKLRDKKDQLLIQDH